MNTGKEIRIIDTIPPGPEEKILYCIKRYGCRCASRHTCQLRNCWSTPHALLEILQKHLHLEVEGMSDSLHHSTLFGTWISAYKSDKLFGALFDVLLNHCLEEI